MSAINIIGVVGLAYYIPIAPWYISEVMFIIPLHHRSTYPCPDLLYLYSNMIHFFIQAYNIIPTPGTYQVCYIAALP